MSCTLHDVQVPQSASASITTSHFVAISWRRSTGAGLVNVGLAKRSTRAPLAVEPLLEPVEEDVAARLADVEQADGLAVERRRAGRSALARRDGCARRSDRARTRLMSSRPTSLRDGLAARSRHWPSRR